jgi:hypothetical protein
MSQNTRRRKERLRALFGLGISGSSKAHVSDFDENGAGGEGAAKKVRAG